MKKRTIVERVFWSPNYFTIAIRQKNKNELPIWKRRSFVSNYIMPSIRNYWVADPMLVEDNEKTYLFYEAVHCGKGQIEVVEILNNGAVSRPTVALSEEYHLSYPFVFKHDDEWYMIPESCSINKVNLLKAKHFPTDWEYTATLLNEYAVDTTVQSIDGRLLLLTFVPEAETERVYPKAFWINWDNNINLKEIPWSDFDPLQVRGAGKIIEDNGQYIRPAQINQISSYGDGIVFMEFSCSDDLYKEKEVGHLFSDDLQVSGWKIDGLHTYTSTERFEAIDVRCQLPDPLKVLRKLLRHWSL